MALHYTKRKDEQEKNTADPWNIYGVNFGKENKSDSEKVAWELRTIKEAPAGLKETEETEILPDSSSSPIVEEED